MIGNGGLWSCNHILYLPVRDSLYLCIVCIDVFMFRDGAVWVVGITEFAEDWRWLLLCGGCPFVLLRHGVRRQVLVSMAVSSYMYL
jgi:hypothetical protein